MSISASLRATATIWRTTTEGGPHDIDGVLIERKSSAFGLDALVTPLAFIAVTCDVHRASGPRDRVVAPTGRVQSGGRYPIWGINVDAQSRPDVVCGRTEMHYSMGCWRGYANGRGW